jgi:hypothetical protein
LALANPRDLVLPAVVRATAHNGEAGANTSADGSATSGVNSTVSNASGNATGHSAEDGANEKQRDARASFTRSEVGFLEMMMLGASHGFRSGSENAAGQERSCQSGFESTVHGKTPLLLPCLLYQTLLDPAGLPPVTSV